MSDRRKYDLTSVRADGWFGRLAEQAPHFGQLCDAVGDKVVAFSIIAGARITSVHVDQRSPETSLIEFNVGDEEEVHKLTLVEFRQRLSATLASLEVPGELPAEDATDDQLQDFLGFRTVLLSALYGIELRALHVGGEAPPSVEVGISDAQEEVPLDELRTAIRQRVRAEAAARGPGFSIDLAVVDDAEEAAEAKEWPRVHELLHGWLGPLAGLLRSPEGYALTPDVRDRLATALALLGSAYEALDVAERSADCFRLGVQWAQAQNSHVLADIFVRFGRSLVNQNDHGKAVGMLRRSLTLGADEADVLPLLARCYAATGRWLAAAICAENALARGADEPAVADVLKRATGALGDPWTAFRARIPAPDGSAETRPPGAS